jgi:hypothetical protein
MIGKIIRRLPVAAGSRRRLQGSMAGNEAARTGGFGTALDVRQSEKPGRQDPAAQRARDFSQCAKPGAPQLPVLATHNGSSETVEVTEVAKQAPGKILTQSHGTRGDCAKRSARGPRCSRRVQ